MSLGSAPIGGSFGFVWHVGGVVFFGEFNRAFDDYATELAVCQVQVYGSSIDFRRGGGDRLDVWN